VGKPTTPYRTANNAGGPGDDVFDVEAVYRAYGRRCYALALRIVRDAQLAEYVAQEVFTTVHRDPTRFDPARGVLATWLMTLTHHKAVDVAPRPEDQVIAGGPGRPRARRPERPDPR
jgi:DNA-directed RNA polymerase specialized sigma24 family protein